MTNEEKTAAYKKWWFGFSSPERNCMGIAEAFDAGWEAAINNAMPMTADELIHIARQNERDAIERKLLAMAGAAFIAGNDEHAHWFRSLVNVLFKKPGDESA